MNIASRGATMAVDWEQRIDFARLRSERLEKARASLRESSLGAVLLFDQNNIRYVSSTHIGEWARDKSARCVLLPREGDPVLWDFGSAAKHHQLYAPWLPESSWQAGVTSMRGAMPRETGVPDALAARIHRELAERGLAGEPLGIDLTDMETLYSLQRQGIETADAQPVMMRARAIKTDDEIALLEHAAAIVDAVYDEIYRMLRPGVREHEVVARAMQMLFELGSEQVEAINAVSGDRCNPHPHVFSDRLLRPGDQAFFDVIHSFMGYRTCYYRTFNVGGVTRSQIDAYKQCREWLDTAIDLVRPGATTDQIASVWPTAQELGFPDEQSCFGLQFGHGLGVGLYEAPMISRVHSLDHPIEIEEGMVFALETYCAASDGESAARIEEEVVVTATGLPRDHALPGRGAARLRQDLRARRRPARARRIDCLRPKGIEMGRVQDRVVIVTGGAGGIGAAACRAIAAEGAKVVVADLDADAARAVADEIVASGGSAESIGVDVTDRAQVQAMIAQGRRGVRRAERDLQQRRHEPPARLHGGRRGELRGDRPRQHVGRDRLHPGGGEADDRAGLRRQDRQHRLDREPPGLLGLRPVLLCEVRRRSRSPRRPRAA